MSIQCRQNTSSSNQNGLSLNNETNAFRFYRAKTTSGRRQQPSPYCRSISFRPISCYSLNESTLIGAPFIQQENKGRTIGLENCKIVRTAVVSTTLFLLEWEKPYAYCLAKIVAFELKQIKAPELANFRPVPVAPSSSLSP
jgi:hypothetical protein